MDREQPTENYRLSLRDLLLIAAFGASMLSFHLGSARALTFHETYFAQPAKEMLATGRWVIPTIASEPSLDRTPLTAWLIALSMKLFGSDAEWVVRMPSLVCGIATALLFGIMGARWFGRRVGVLAALIELTTAQMVTHARLAEAEAPLTLCVTAAMYFFALGNVAGPRERVTSPWLPSAFYAATALSFMVKWMFGPAFIGLGCVAYCLVKRDGRAFRFLLDPLGLATAALLTVPWLVAARWEYPNLLEAFLFNHFGRFDGAMGTREPWYAYLYLVPFLLIPWFPYALPTFVSRFRNAERREPFWLFGACWFLPGMALLSFSAFKAKHYAVPLTAPLVVAAAVGLHEYLLRRKESSGRLLPGMIGASALAGCGVIALLVRLRPDGLEGTVAVIAMLAVGGTASLCFDYLRRWKLQLVTAFATLWISFIAGLVWVMPTHDSFLPLARFGERTKDHVPEGAVVHLVNLPESQIPFYIDRPQRRWDHLAEFDADAAAEVSRSAAHDSEIYVVTSRDYLKTLKTSLGSVEVLDSATREAHHTSDRDRLVLLRIGVDRRPVEMATQTGGTIIR